MSRMIQKLKLSSRHARQAASAFLAVLMIGSVSYIGVKLYDASRAATPGTVYITSASTTVTSGSTISLTVREESGTSPVNSIGFLMRYNPAHLQYVDPVVESGNFPFVGPTSTDEPGIIRVTRGIQGGSVTGDKAVVTLNFKVLATSGTTAVSIDNNKLDTVLYSQGENILQSTAGQTYTISSGTNPTPAPTQPPATVVKNATLSMTPASGSYSKGQTISVDINLATPTQRVQAVQTILNYPANQLQYVDTVQSGAFPIASRSNNTSGTLDLIRSVNGGSPGFQGSTKVVTARFKVIGQSGAIPISFKNIPGNTTSVLSNLNEIFAGLASGARGANYSIAGGSGGGTNPTPAPTSAPAPAPTSPPTNKPGSSPTPARAPAIYRNTVTYTPQSGGSASLDGNNTEVQGEVGLTPVIDESILLENPGDTIIKVEYIIGKKKVATKTSSPFTFNLNTKDYKNGTYTMTIKTYYQSGTVDTSTDKLVVSNPVTLGYIFKHYLGAIIATLLLLPIVAFLIWKFVWPRFFGGGRDRGDGYDSGSYQGYDGYADPNATSNPSVLPESPDPSVISPTSVAPDSAAVYPPQPVVTPAAPQPPENTGVTTFQPGNFETSDQPSAPASPAPVPPAPAYTAPVPTDGSLPTVNPPERRQY